MLEKTEGTIKNRQSRDTDSIGHKTQTEYKLRVNVGAREGEAGPVYEKTPAVCSNLSQVKVIYNGWTNGVFISP